MPLFTITVLTGNVTFLRSQSLEVMPLQQSQSSQTNATLKVTILTNATLTVTMLTGQCHFGSHSPNKEWRLNSHSLSGSRNNCAVHSAKNEALTVTMKTPFVSALSG